MSKREAAQKQDMATLYKITKSLAGGFKNSIEENIIDTEILRLCEKGVLEETTHCKGECISPIFTRRKKMAFTD